MKYTALVAATAALVVAAAAYHDGRAWTTATQTQPPVVAGFTLRPTPPAQRVPRRGLVLREDDDDDDDDDDNGNGAGKITRGSVTATATGTLATSTDRGSNTCGWEKNGGGFYACADSRATCQYTNGVAGCCSGDSCRKIPKTCVARGSKCDSDDNGGTLCCGHSSAPACYTWFISTSSAGTQQQTYSMFGCTDKPGSATLLPTAPAAAGGSGGGRKKKNTGAIVGGVIGGMLALLLIAVFAWYVVRQRRRGRVEAQQASRSNSEQSRGGAASWVQGRDAAHEHDGEKNKTHSAYAVEQAPVPRRRPVGSVGYSSVTESDGSSPNRQVAYSVSSVGSQVGTGYVSSLSPAPPPLDGVVEAPDTGVRHGAGVDVPVEVAGTTVTRNTVQNRAELE